MEFSERYSCGYLWRSVAADEKRSCHQCRHIRDTVSIKQMQPGLAISLAQNVPVPGSESKGNVIGQKCLQDAWQLSLTMQAPTIRLQSAMPRSMTDSMLESLLACLAEFYFSNPFRLEHLRSSEAARGMRI